MRLEVTSKFRKDYKRCVKRGLDVSSLEKIIDLLLDGKTLDEQYKDHPLSGNYLGFRECNIQSDWLLIYKKDTNNLILTAVRTGTHSDLFDE